MTDYERLIAFITTAKLNHTQQKAIFPYQVENDPSIDITVSIEQQKNLEWERQKFVSIGTQNMRFIFDKNGKLLSTTVSDVRLEKWPKDDNQDTGGILSPINTKPTPLSGVERKKIALYD